MVKGFHYTGSTILGYRLVLVKSPAKKGNKYMLDSNFSYRKNSMNSNLKSVSYKGKR